ncbi:MAG: hypothetical protein GY906_00905 [bacterium]|nr:hypothetical protein [bacterium]
MQAIASNRLKLAVGFALTDSLILILSAVAAAWIRFPPSYLTNALEELLLHPAFVLYALAAHLAVATTFDLYRPEQWRTRDRLFVRLAAAAMVLPVGLAIGVYLVPPWRFGRGLLALTVLMAIPMMGLIRLIWLRVASRPPLLNAVIVGDGPIVENLISEINDRPLPPFKILRHIRDPLGDAAPGTSASSLEDANLVIVAQLDRDSSIDKLAALNFRGTPVLDAAGAYAALTGRIPVRQVDSAWFIATGDFASLATSPFHTLQRLLDCTAALLLLILSAPILGLASLAILLNNGIPILYRQERLGKNRKTFTLYKLRTMKQHRASESAQFAESGDARVFWVGRWLRRWRIDELPQLINVIRGDMSLVGPRPERPDIADEFEQRIPFFAFRYSVRPGLTGWAQVNLPYCANDEEHIAKIEYDLFAIRHHGPAMYAMVLIRTLGALVFRPGR